MPLLERDRLLRAYRAAVHNYNESFANFDELRFHDSLQRTERALNQVEAAREALLKHEHRNVDAIGPQHKPRVPGRIVIVGSTVSLFELTTGHWELFEIGAVGHPPADALAYAPGGNVWITDVQDMNDRQNQHTTMYFTEAGLAILRDAGLEM